MDCERVLDSLGRYVDAELSEDNRRAIESHLADCPACAAGLADLRGMLAELAPDPDIHAPPDLWPAIERRRAVSRRRPHRVFRGRLPGSPLARAAVLLMASGLGVLAVIWAGGDASRASASTVNFSVLLDALPVDARTAFQKFLVLYNARLSTPDQVRRYARALRFAVPPSLPGGFRLQRVYRLEFDEEPGVAAVYDRRGEFLATVFHRPVQREDFGTHRDYPCVIGKHRGHKVEVGRWKLVHLTDPTTCHCVLSRLDERSELPAVLSAVAPGFPDAASQDRDH